MKFYGQNQKGISFARSQAGLTLIELLLVVGILATLVAIAFVSIGNIHIISSGNSVSVVFMSDLKNQQIKAMAGDTEGRGVPDNYGVKIFSNRYVLFHGLSYDQNDTTNFSVPIDDNQRVSTTFANATIVFASESGELLNFVTNQDTITFTATPSGQVRTIKLNKYGTVISNN